MVYKVCILKRQGIVALWREALLAKKVLEGETKGHTKHAQLIRFRERANPIAESSTSLSPPQAGRRIS